MTNKDLSFSYFYSGQCTDRCRGTLKFFSTQMYSSNSTVTYIGQRDGTAMGLLLGPLLVDIFMSLVENSALNHVINDFPLRRRYVNNIFWFILFKCNMHVTVQKLSETLPRLCLIMTEKLPSIYLCSPSTQNGRIARM